MAQNTQNQTEMAQDAAVLFSRALAKVDTISPKALVDPMRDLLEAGLRAIVVGAKRDLAPATMRALAIAEALVDAPADPEPGTGTFAN